MLHVVVQFTTVATTCSNANSNTLYLPEDKERVSALQLAMLAPLLSSCYYDNRNEENPVCCCVALGTLACYLVWW